MKKRVILFLILLSPLIFGIGAIINSSSASSDGNGDITLRWSTTEEVGIKEFVITRCNPPSADFTEIYRMPARGGGSNYQYLDRSAYKEMSSLLFKYKILIIDNQGNNSGSFEVSVSQNLSDVKRTWGSIKAMFR